MIKDTEVEFSKKNSTLSIFFLSEQFPSYVLDLYRDTFTIIIIIIIIINNNLFIS